MNNTPPIVNRVASSGLVSLDLEEFYHSGDRKVIDLADYLYEGLILKEKNFRSALKEVAWESYAGTNVAVVCSADTIVPTWAYMLVMQYLIPHCHKAVIGTSETLEYALFQEALERIDWEKYNGARVVVKGCGDLPVPESAYGELTARLVPRVASLMYGEPCSTVPVYKRPRK